MLAEANVLQQSTGLAPKELITVSELRNEIHGLRQETERQKVLLREYKKAIDTVRIENEELRAQLLSRLGPTRV